MTSATPCTCRDHHTYRQLDPACPIHGDDAERRRRQLVDDTPATLFGEAL